ncbi:hypothetical protein FRX94_12030 [Corynebacterium canis]|uniref:DUF2927 domain-containing protein n=1 Tax=Corynebacterium canis TaxID=679663 RepID=A0A5C5TV15_9CORY|nr:hypothetical protein [Corynebacterium canis]TWT18073.1 hypothetical protein FRX94_12030 [Corynebacterium canis]WJY74232.1 hypothetical protein CCANI_01870 [Corynebacterium canis]
MGAFSRVLRPAVFLIACVSVLAQVGCSFSDFERDEASQVLQAEFEEEFEALGWANKPTYRRFYSPFSYHITVDIDLGNVSQGRLRQVRDTLFSQRERAEKQKVPMQFTIAAEINSSVVNLDEQTSTSMLDAMLPLAGVGVREMGMSSSNNWVTICSDTGPLCGPDARQRLIQQATMISAALTEDPEGIGQQSFRMYLEQGSDTRPLDINVVVPEQAQLDGEGMRGMLFLHDSLVAASAPATVSTLHYVVGQGVSYMHIAAPGDEWTPELEASIGALAGLVRAHGVADYGTYPESRGMAVRFVDVADLLHAQMLGCSDPTDIPQEQRLRELVEEC